MSLTMTGLYTCKVCNKQQPDAAYDFDNMETTTGQILCKRHMKIHTLLEIDLRKLEFESNEKRKVKEAKDKAKLIWRKFGTVKPRKRSRIEVEIKYTNILGESTFINTGRYDNGYVTNNTGIEPVEPWDLWRYA